MNGMVEGSSRVSVGDRPRLLAVKSFLQGSWRKAKMP